MKINYFCSCWTQPDCTELLVSKKEERWCLEKDGPARTCMLERLKAGLSVLSDMQRQKCDKFRNSCSQPLEVCVSPANKTNRKEDSLSLCLNLTVYFPPGDYQSWSRRFVLCAHSVSFIKLCVLLCLAAAKADAYHAHSDANTQVPRDHTFSLLHLCPHIPMDRVSGTGLVRVYIWASEETGTHIKKAGWVSSLSPWWTHRPWSLQGCYSSSDHTAATMADPMSPLTLSGQWWNITDKGTFHICFQRQGSTTVVLCHCSVSLTVFQYCTLQCGKIPGEMPQEVFAIALKPFVFQEIMDIWTCCLCSRWLFDPRCSSLSPTFCWLRL